MHAKRRSSGNRTCDMSKRKNDVMNKKKEKNKRKRGEASSCFLLMRALVLNQALIRL